MTKFVLWSDLHLEFKQEFVLPEFEEEVDVFILAGDIHTKIRSVKFAESVFEKYGKPVLLLAGNHEYYGSSLIDVDRKIKEAISKTSADIRFLNPGVAHVGDTRFIGGTLWTDFNLFGNPSKGMDVADSVMNDYKRIRLGGGAYRPIRPSDTLSLHRTHLAFFKQEIEKDFDGKTVIVSHHAPSLNSVSSEHHGEYVSSAYASDLSEFVEQFSPDMWLHGHTHTAKDYVLGKTVVTSNCRGYPEEKNSFDPVKIYDTNAIEVNNKFSL